MLQTALTDLLGITTRWQGGMAGCHLGGCSRLEAGALGILGAGNAPVVVRNQIKQSRAHGQAVWAERAHVFAMWPKSWRSAYSACRS